MSAQPLMLPLMLDVTRVPIFVIGNATAAITRLAMLEDHGALNVLVFADQPTADLRAKAADRLIERWPTPTDFAELKPRLVFAADAPEDLNADIKHQADAAGAFVHVQDRIPLCDFHLPAMLRRGRLLVTVSTDGAAAGLSRLVRDHLATILGSEWGARVEDLAKARKRWKADGLSMNDLFKAITQYVQERGWFTASPPSKG